MKPKNVPAADTSLLTWHNLFHTVEGLVAVGTLCLAAVTFFLVLATFWMARRTASLAASTSREVDAVAEQIELERGSLVALESQVAAQRDQAEAANRAVQATIRPVLVDLARPLRTNELAAGGAHEHEVGWESAQERRRMPEADAFVWEDDNGLYFTVPLRNVGPGTAFIRGVGLRWQRQLQGGGTVTHGVVPSGEVTRVQFIVPKYEGANSATLAEFESYATFSLEVSYTDVAGEQWTMTRADVSRDARTGRWMTRQIYLFHKRGEENGSVDWGESVASSTASWGL